MCRLLGMMSDERVHVRFGLEDAPHSLAMLSCDHPDGWGIAVHSRENGWTLEKCPMRASECSHFHRAASTLAGELLIAHVRQRSMGDSKFENTHPFQSGSWMFAHNGNITDIEWLRHEISPGRLASVKGDTDSELLFAFLLSRLDQVNVRDRRAADDVLLGTMRQVTSRASFGSCTFLLSDGQALYAHRFGRPLFTLELHLGDDRQIHHASQETGASLHLSWPGLRHAVLSASEKLTDERWEPLAEGVLGRFDWSPSAHWTTIV